ncbi:hypothetical protein C8Q78DRAFT_1045244 [Trametes maxima]|nr:hypothetical protein C8Q78DRAFT_1045244 [Trametes maxima]
MTRAQPENDPDADAAAVDAALQQGAAEPIDEQELAQADATSARQSVRGSTPLSEPPDDGAPVGQLSDEQDGQRTTGEEHEDPDRTPTGASLVDELLTLVDNANERYANVHTQLISCLQSQEELTARFNNLRAITLDEQVGLKRTLERVRAQYPRSHAIGQDGGPTSSQRTETRRSDAPYADSTDALEQSRNMLFREREPDEASSAYGRRQHAQRRLLAREHYEDGVRERNHRAEQWWAQRVAEEGGQQNHAAAAAADNAPAPGDGGSSSSSSSDDERDHRSNNRASDTPRPARRREGDGGRDSAIGREHRGRSVSPLRRVATRSPTYLRDDDMYGQVREWTDPNVQYIEDPLCIIRRMIPD